MPKILVEYTLTEITRQRLWMEAEDEADAITMMEDYEFDNTEQYQVDSLRWEIDAIEVVEGAELIE